jgi:hypothetical protein
MIPHESFEKGVWLIGNVSQVFDFQWREKNIAVF